MNNQKSLKSNAIFSFFKAFLNIATPLITFPYASRILLPEGIGRVNFANTVVTYFLMIAKLGIDNYAIREASKIKDDKTKLTKLAKELFTINSISTIISFSLFFAAIFIIPKFSDYRTLLIICSVRMAVMLFEVPWLFSAKEEFKSVTIRTSIFQVLSLIYLFIFVKTPQDVNYYGLFGILTIAGTSISNFICAQKFVDLKIKIKLELKKHIPFILTFFGMAFITNFYNMLDTIMLGFLSTDAEVGYYSSAIKINNLVIELISAITVVLLPRLSYLIEKKDIEQFSNLTKKSLNIILLISIPSTAGIFLLSQHIVLILSGKEFMSAVLPMKIMSPLVIFITTSNLIGAHIFPAINKEKKALVVYSMAIIINIVLNIILIPMYGSLGAAISTVIAEFFVTLVLLTISFKLLFSTELLINIMQILLATAVMIISIILINSYVHIFLLQILLSILIGMGVYSTVLFIVKNVYFIEILNKFIRRK